MTMMMTGEGIFDIQLAHHSTPREPRSSRNRDGLLRSRARDLGLDVPTVATSFEPLTEREARFLTTKAIYDARPAHR